MLGSLLSPSSIAVVGVSLDPDKVGHQIFVNLSNFPGELYPVNPKHKKILGKTCYPDLLSIPKHVDQVIIATPAPTVEAVVDQCLDKKVKSVIIISAGFAETSAQGKIIQDEIASKLASAKIELLGPNTLGAINPGKKLNASFAPKHIAPGNIALISQSGATLTAIFSELQSREVGCSFAISLGNKAGITEIDALEYAQRDPNTKVIALYLESLSNPRQFLKMAKQITRTKPVILLKGGTTSAGRQASLSHTAALATSSTLLKEAAHQAGFVLVETIEEFIELMFFADIILNSKRKLPSNLMIMTNAGGPAVNATDLADTAKLKLATWSNESRNKFARELPRVIPNNPTDLLGDASVETIRLGMEFAQEDESIESLLLIITPQAVTNIPGIAKMITALKFKKPLVVALMGGEDQHRYTIQLRRSRIPTVEYASEGIEMFALLSQISRANSVDRSDLLMKQLEKAISQTEPRKVIERRLVPLRVGELEETYILLENYGLTLPRCAIVNSEDEINQISKLDPKRVFPLVVKTANLKLKHKAIVGGVVTNVGSLDETKAAYRKLDRLGSKVLLQEQIKGATELILGAKRDKSFGPFLAVGTGGGLTNIVADRAYLFLPASGKEIRSCLGRTKIATTLSREQKSLVAVTMERIAKIFEEHPEIEELEINPLMITKDQALVADVKVALK